LLNLGCIGSSCMRQECDWALTRALLPLAGRRADELLPGVHASVVGPPTHMEPREATYLSKRASQGARGWGAVGLDSSLGLAVGGSRCATHAPASPCVLLRRGRSLHASPPRLASGTDAVLRHTLPLRQRPTPTLPPARRRSARSRPAVCSASRGAGAAPQDPIAPGFFRPVSTASLQSNRSRGGHCAATRGLPSAGITSHPGQALDRGGPRQAPSTSSV
jgi:hypothetical protein